MSEIIVGSSIKKNNYNFKCNDKDDRITSIDDWLIIHGTTSICLTSLIIYLSLFYKKKTCGYFCSFFFLYIFNFVWILFGCYIFFNMCHNSENLNLYLLVVLISSYIAILNNILTGGGFYKNSNSGNLYIPRRYDYNRDRFADDFPL